jgi:hypothetical protein
MFIILLFLIIATYPFIKKWHPYINPNTFMYIYVSNHNSDNTKKGTCLKMKKKIYVRN